MQRATGLTASECQHHMDYIAGADLRLGERVVVIAEDSSVADEALLFCWYPFEFGYSGFEFQNGRGAVYLDVLVPPREALELQMHGYLFATLLQMNMGRMEYETGMKRSKGA